MKRWISALLLTVMLLALTACTGAPVDSGKGGGEIDFYGQEFIFRDGDKGSDFIFTNGATVHGDMVLARYKEMEDLYNCIFTVETGTAKEMTLAFAIWDHYTDLMSMRMKHLYTQYAADYILPLEEISTIDLYSGKYGPTALLESLNWKGDTVAFWPAYWGIPTPCFQDALMYNPRLVSEFGLTDPQELYERGEWNWATYQSMATTVAGLVNYNSSEELPVYFSCFDHYTLRLALFSNGAELITKNNSGDYELSLTSTKALEAFNWARDLSKINSFMEYSSVGTTNETFYTGRMLFIPEYSVTGIMHSDGKIANNMQEEWRYCYYPIGPSGTKADIEKAYVSDETRFVFACRLTDDTDQLGLVMELLFEPVYPSEYGWEDNFYDINFFDDFSVEYYKTKWSNVRFDNSVFVNNYASMLSNIVDTVAGKGTVSSIEAFVEANGETLQDQINTKINNLK